MIILAIDPGLAFTGWALVNATTLKLLSSGTVRTRPADGDVIKRCMYMAWQIPIKGADAVFIEQPFSGRYKGSAETYFVAGMLAGVSVASGMTPRMISPVTWSAGAGKMAERMANQRAKAMKIFKVSKLTSEHERDALGLALWAATTGGCK